MLGKGAISFAPSLRLSTHTRRGKLFQRVQTCTKILFLLESEIRGKVVRWVRGSVVWLKGQCMRTEKGMLGVYVYRCGVYAYRCGVYLSDTPPPPPVNLLLADTPKNRDRMKLRDSKRVHLYAGGTQMGVSAFSFPHSFFCLCSSFVLSSGRLILLYQYVLTAAAPSQRGSAIGRLWIRIRVGEPYSYTLTFCSATKILTKRIRIRIQRRRPSETCSWSTEATEPYSTCVLAYSRSLRIHFTAEFAPFFSQP